MHGHSRRRGFGMAIGLVLAIVGVSLLVLLGSEMISHGSRATFERAIYAARATSIAQEAIEEVSFNPKYR